MLYSADGIDLLDSYGPLHLVAVDAANGGTTLVAARAHTNTRYGTVVGLPGANDSLTESAPKHSPKETYTAASLSGTAFPTDERDKRTTVYRYSIDGSDEGFVHKTALETITKMAATTDDISRRIRLDRATGLTVENRMPSDTGGTGAGTTVTTYFKVGTTDLANCVNSAWVNLPCRVALKDQSSLTLPKVPVTTYEYDYLLRTVKTVATPPGGEAPRVSTTEFENAGLSPRPVKSATTGGLGTGVKPTVTVYDPNTGLPTQTKFDDGTGAISTSYDDFGRVTGYTDANGETTTTTYESSTGRVTQVASSVNTLTYAYNSPTERRGVVTSVNSTALGGSISGTYDANGTLSSQQLPNGPVMTVERNTADDPTRLTWSKDGATWFTDSQTSSVHGQWRTHGGYASEQTYGYDQAGRLVRVQDRLVGGTSPACTTRVYALDKNSNRLSKTAYKPTDAGECSTSSGTSSSTAYTYDPADRLKPEGVHAGLAYDAYGRTTLLPAGSSGTSSDTTISYYNTDLVASQSAGGVTRSWTLDAAGRRNSTTSGTATKVSHYDGTEDNPAWIDEGDGTRTVYTTGLDGNMVASTVGTATTYQLGNLHGDIATTAAAGSTGPGASLEADEFGVTGGSDRYGWLGGKQRSAEALGRLVLMGARLYSPALGRFSSVDPVYGGSANAYSYVDGDPLTQLDLDGRKTCNSKKGNWFKRRACNVKHVAGNLGVTVSGSVILGAGFSGSCGISARSGFSCQGGIGYGFGLGASAGGTYQNASIYSRTATCHAAGVRAIGGSRCKDSQVNWSSKRRVQWAGTVGIGVPFTAYKSTEKSVSWKPW